MTASTDTPESEASGLTRRTRLIAFAGIDGCGKSTQVRLLESWLRGQQVTTLRFESASLRPLKNAIWAQTGSADFDGMLGVDASQFAAAAVKWLSLHDIVRHLDGASAVVIADRYAQCQIAAGYRASAPVRTVIEAIFRVFPPPDMTIFLDVDVDLAATRVDLRGGEEPADRAFLHAHRAAYLQLPEASVFHVVDGSSDVQSVHEKVRTVVAEALSEWHVTR